MNLLRIMSLLAGCLLANACGNLTTMEADDTAHTSQYARTGNLKVEVDSLVQPLIAKGEAPGMVVGVLLPDGRMRFFGYGVAVSGGQAPNADTLFPVGSLSKGFLGALVAVLVDEGVFAWSDTLEKLLPADTILSPDARKITLEQLATHTSGLPRQPFDLQTFEHLVQFVFTGENFYRHYDRDYCLRYLADFKAPAQPVPQYSNIGYAILGELVERHTGKKLDTLLAQKILQPLRLEHTGYQAEQLAGYADRAQGHAGDQPKFMLRGQPVADWQFTEIMKGSAGIYSNARDLLLFAAAHMDAGKDHLQAILADNLRVRVAQPEDAPGIAWVTDDFSGLSITNQVGVMVGHTSYVGIDIKRHTAVVVLQNSFNWNYKVGHKLLLRMAQAIP